MQAGKTDQQAYIERRIASLIQLLPRKCRGLINFLETELRKVEQDTDQNDLKRAKKLYRLALLSARRFAFGNPKFKVEFQADVSQHASSVQAQSSTSTSSSTARSA